MRYLRLNTANAEVPQAVGARRNYNGKKLDAIGPRRISVREMKFDGSG
jgi:hypothetical protein